MKALQHTINHGHFVVRNETSLWQQFLNWCSAQEKDRLAWLAAIIAGHGCVITPLTVMFIVLAGNMAILWPFAIGAMGICLVTNLAAMPTKITIPVFFFSLLIDIAIIFYSVAILLG